MLGLADVVLDSEAPAALRTGALGLKLKPPFFLIIELMALVLDDVFAWLSVCSDSEGCLGIHV